MNNQDTSVDVYERLVDALEAQPSGFTRTPSKIEIELIKHIFTYEEAWLAASGEDSLGGAAVGARFIWPVTGIVSRGYKADPSSGTPHLGLDIAGRTGAPVKAALGGRIAFAGQDSVFGNMLIIEHGGGLSTLYGHNSQLLAREGDLVVAGQMIARLGSTGRSSAPHLHFEVRESDTTVDPLKYLRKQQ